MENETLTKNMKNLQSLLSMMSEDHLTKQDFVDHFEKVTNLVLEIKKSTLDEVEQLRSAYQMATEQHAKTTGEAHSTSLQELEAKTEEAVNNLNFQFESMMSVVEQKLLEVKDGKDVDEQTIIDAVLARLPAREELEPETAISVRDKLESIQDEDEKLTIEAIKGLREELDRLEKRARNLGGVIGGSHPLSTLADVNAAGVTNGQVLAWNATLGRWEPSSAAGGGGVNVETPTGTVNGINTVFTVLNEPKYIVVDTNSKFVTVHYTYVAGTITITDGAPPTQFIRSFY